VEAEWITAIAESVSATTSVLLLVTSVVLAVVAVWQLPMIAKQIKAQSEQLRVQGERERKWATVRECARYTSDPIIYEATARIWKATEGGKNYGKHDTIDKHDIITVLNYLEGIAVGVTQGLLVEAIVKDHFDVAISKIIKVYFEGEDGPTWSVDEPMFKGDEYRVLRSLYRKWETRSPETSYTDRT
jgi:hypothetical protein